MLEHKHIIIRATVKKPPTQTDVIKQWVINLVEKLNMKPLGDTVTSHRQ